MEEEKTSPNVSEESALTPEQRISELERELEQARKILTNRASFLSDASHEIRTPMNAILSTVSLALTEEQPAHTRELFEKIGVSARQMLALLNDILDMSRIDGGQVAVRNVEFSLRLLLDQIGAAMSGPCAAKGLLYSCHTGEGLKEFYIGDIVHLRQVFIAVLGNAVKFTEKGGHVALRVEREGLSDTQDMLLFVVEDTGIGMDPAFLDRVYDAFSREETGVRRTTDGSGLGLAIARKTIELMDGTIDIRSERGSGTQVSVRIPLGKSARDEELKPVVVGAVSPQTGKGNADKEGGRLAGRRILVAEDLQINAQIVMDHLKKKGLLAEHAANGQIALEMYTVHDPGYYDAVLMDMRMPVMDGEEAARAIRASGRADASAIPIIAMTAGASEQDAQKLAAAGFRTYLSKPVDPVILLDMLKEMVK